MFKPWLSRIKMAKAYVAGDLTSAITYAQKCLDKDKKDVAALWTVAECFRLQDNYNEAINYARQGFAADPNHLDTLMLLANIYFDQKDYRSTYEYASKAISVIEELDITLGPHIKKIREALSSSSVLSRPTRSFRLVIDKENNSTKEWTAWALEFKAWYESNNPEIQSKEVH